MITAFVVGNSLLILTLTILLIRESNRRRGLELVLRESIELWKGVYETNLDGRDDDPGLHAERGLRD